MSATKGYKVFHGKPHRYKRPLRFHDPKELVFLGRAVGIIYESDKLNGGGDGQRHQFIHYFEPGASLLADERMGQQLYIISPKITVKSPGIIG